MKYLLAVIAVFSALLTVGVAALFVAALAAWLKGGFNVVLPGLGLVVSGTFVLAVLLVAGVGLFVLTWSLVRFIWQNRRLR